MALQAPRTKDAFTAKGTEYQRPGLRVFAEQLPPNLFSQIRQKNGEHKVPAYVIVGVDGVVVAVDDGVSLHFRNRSVPLPGTSTFPRTDPFSKKNYFLGRTKVHGESQKTRKTK